MLNHSTGQTLCLSPLWKFFECPFALHRRAPLPSIVEPRPAVVVQRLSLSGSHRVFLHSSLDSATLWLQKLSLLNLEGCLVTAACLDSLTGVEVKPGDCVKIDELEVANAYIHISQVALGEASKNEKSKEPVVVYL
ncbi:hypothetical protein HN51_065929 [Arachis hypogaea]